MDNLRIKKKTKKTQAPRFPAREARRRQSLRGSRGNPQGQDGWANIWCAVLAVGWAFAVAAIAWMPRWPGPEVLLSLLPTNLTLYRSERFSSFFRLFGLDGPSMRCVFAPGRGSAPAPKGRVRRVR